MKITVYTITDCQFSKQEKDYLNTNKLTFEEKNLETNREFLTEMLAISNNFAGTPVTKIEKDDGQISVLKGFTKEEFDKVLGLGADAAKPEVAAQPEVPPAEAPKAEAAPTPEPAQPSMPAPEPPAPAPIAPAAPTEEPKVDIVTPAAPGEPVAQEPAAPPAPEPAAPVAPAPVAPAPETPAAPAQPDPMASVLNSLQEQANAPTPAAPATDMPNIPDPKL